MFSLEELLSNCYVLLFQNNLTAKFDEKQARFKEINRNLDSPESFWPFPGICFNIPRNLPEHSPESAQHFPESARTFPGIFSNIPRNAKMKTFPGIL